MSDAKQEFIDEVMRLANLMVRNPYNLINSRSNLEAFLQERIGEPVNVDAVGRWLSAALDDPNVCVEMKTDIEHWLELTNTQLYQLDGGKLALLRRRS